MFVHHLFCFVAFIWHCVLYLCLAGWLFLVKTSYRIWFIHFLFFYGIEVLKIIVSYGWNLMHNAGLVKVNTKKKISRKISLVNCYEYSNWSSRIWSSPIQSYISFLFFLLGMDECFWSNLIIAKSSRPDYWTSWILV